MRRTSIAIRTVALIASFAIAGALAASGLGATADARHLLQATTVTTSLSATSTTVGGAGVHDTATLAGLTGTTFTGDLVTYAVYPSLNDCTAGTNGTAEGSVTVAGNGAVAASNTFTPASAGTYYWRASFNGADHVNAAASSDCSSEPLAVTAVTHPTVTTALSASSTTVGGAGVHDTATLAGLAGTAFTGDLVTYTVYPSLNDCTSGTNGVNEGSVTVTGNGAVAASSTFMPASAGTYYWSASFNGADHTNAAGKSDCSSEPLTVTAATGPTLTTTLSAAVARVGGTGVFDTATLSGLSGTSFTGDLVTYTVYPSLSDCTAGTNGTAEGSAAVSGNGPVAPSTTFMPTTPGIYFWQASFNGADHTNAAVSSSCSAEPLAVTTHPVSRGRRHFLCRPLFLGKGHHRHHHLFICFRIGRFPFLAHGGHGRPGALTANLAGGPGHDARGHGHHRH